MNGRSLSLLPHETDPQRLCGDRIFLL